MEPRSSRRQRNAPTINDVAKHAGVSPMTVSRVINGEQIVRSATKAKVEAAIAALNYSPGAAARSLAGGADTRIGLLARKSVAQGKCVSVRVDLGCRRLIKQKTSQHSSMYQSTITK